MMRRMHRVALGVALLATTACGEDAFIIIEVHADAALTIPDRVNALELQMLSPGDGQELLLVELDLIAGHVFPFEIVVEPSERTPVTIEERVTALLDGVPVARIRTSHSWEKGKVNRAVLPKLEPVP